MWQVQRFLHNQSHRSVRSLRQKILLYTSWHSHQQLSLPCRSILILPHQPWNNLPSIVSDNGVILLHHGIYPCGLLHCFFKRRWLYHDTLAHKSHVSSKSVRWLSLSTLWCRNSYILCRIHLQSLSFYGTLPTLSDVWFCMIGLLHSMNLLLWLIHIQRLIFGNKKFLLCMQV